jgi:hypothetical protein
VTLREQSCGFSFSAGVGAECGRELAATKNVLFEERAASSSILYRKSVTGQRSNQLNYVPTLFSYLYRKTACLLAFLRFNRFACVAHFNPIEPNSEVNGHHDTKLNHRPKLFCRQAQSRAAVPAPRLNCRRANSDQYRFCPKVVRLRSIFCTTGNRTPNFRRRLSLWHNRKEFRQT